MRDATRLLKVQVGQSTADLPPPDPEKLDPLFPPCLVLYPADLAPADPGDASVRVFEWQADLGKWKRIA